MENAQDQLKEQGVRREIEMQLPHDVPIVFEEVFAKLTGFGAKRAYKRRIEWLVKAAPVLQACLAEGERVRFVTFGMVNYNVELLFMGVWANLVNRTLVIVTDRRFLLVHADRKNKPKSYINELPVGSVRQVKRSLFGSLVVKTGKETRIFAGVRGADGKALKNIFEKNKTAQGGIRYLCPACFEPAAAHTTSCRACQVAFKSPRVAALRSLVFPGLGDWYLGHRFLAVFEMIGSAFLWLLFLGALFSLSEEDAEPIVAAVLFGFLVFANGVDAALTHFQGKKGLMSLDDALPTKPGSGTGLGGAPPPPIIS